MMRVFSVVLLIMLFGNGGAFVRPTRCSAPNQVSCPTARTPWAIGSSSGDSQPSEDVNDKSLVDLLLPSKDCKVDQMSGTDLAYIGDVVFELFVRSRKVWPSKRTSDLQDIVVSIVRAENQSQLLDKLKTDFPLSEQELRVLMRGRNAVTRSKNRRNPAAYQDSTAFEALVGYLYISNQQRCTDLLNWLEKIVDDPA